jgi:hypothetical protein
VLDFYVHHHPGYGLGNFVNITPTIHALYKKHGQPIPVYFESDYVKQCYIDSPFIKIINRRQGVRLFGSDLICKDNTMPDYKYVQLKILGNISEDNRAFIDEPKHTPPPFPFGVFINGAGSQAPEYIASKSVNKETQEIIKEAATIPILGTGSPDDKKRNIFDGVFNDIRKSLVMIKQADYVITNSTGMYLAAGAMGKRQLCLMTWHEFERLPRLKTLNKNCIYSNPDNWNGDIRNFCNV